MILSKNNIHDAQINDPKTFRCSPEACFFTANMIGCYNYAMDIFCGDLSESVKYANIFKTKTVLVIMNADSTGHAFNFLATIIEFLVWTAGYLLLKMMFKLGRYTWKKCRKSEESEESEEIRLLNQVLHQLDTLNLN
jgi:hypothetical protein